MRLSRGAIFCTSVFLWDIRVSRRVLVASRRKWGFLVIGAGVGMTSPAWPN